MNGYSLKGIWTNEERMILVSTVALSFAPVLLKQKSPWTARDVEQIKTIWLKRTTNKLYSTVWWHLEHHCRNLGCRCHSSCEFEQNHQYGLDFSQILSSPQLSMRKKRVTEVEIQAPSRSVVKKWRLRQLIWRQIKSDSRWTNSSNRRPFSSWLRLSSTETEKTSEVAQVQFLNSDSCWGTPSTEIPAAEETMKTTPGAPVAETTSQLKENSSSDYSSRSTSSASPATETPADTKGTSATEEAAASAATSGLPSTYQAGKIKLLQEHSAPAAPDYTGLASS